MLTIRNAGSSAVWFSALASGARGRGFESHLPDHFVGIIMTEKVLFAWSGGKDSAMALCEIKRSHGYEIVALLTTVTEGYDRISMHGVRQVLLEQQAESLGLPLEKVFISKASSNEEYESKMQ